MKWLKTLFQAEPGDEGPTLHDLHRAAAALLYEVARADGNIDQEETAHLLAAVEERWHLSHAEMEDIVGELEQHVDSATDLFEFTGPLREHWGPEQRVTLIYDMWAIAAADGNADPLEEHLIRRVNDLLYVSHGDFIRAKLAAQNKTPG